MHPPTLALMPPLPLAVGAVEIVLVLLFVVGGLVKNLFDKAAGTGDGRPAKATPPLVPPRPSAPVPEDERTRRLMEALGIPAPPPPLPTVVAPRPVPPPLPPKAVVTRPTVRPPAPEPSIMQMPPVVTARRRPAPDPTLQRGQALAEPAGQTARPPVPAANLRGLLRTSSRAELRRAILLREVLGPPRALAEAGEAD